MMNRFIFFVAFFYAVIAQGICGDNVQKNIEAYLNGIASLKTDFLQKCPSGDIVYGRLWLERKEGQTFGSMRLDYEKKLQQRIVSVDGVLTVYDLKDKSNVQEFKVSDTPASFILQQAIQLNRGLRVVGPLTYFPENIVAIKLVRSHDPDDGPSLTLFFALYDSKAVKELQRWEVVDLQGNVTAVDLVPETVHINNPSEVDGKFTAPFEQEIIVPSVAVKAKVSGKLRA